VVGLAQNESDLLFLLILGAQNESERHTADSLLHRDEFLVKSNSILSHRTLYISSFKKHGMSVTFQLYTTVDDNMLPVSARFISPMKIVSGQSRRQTK
jgi:hypothetical protein